MSWDVIAVAISAAISRSSMTVTATWWPWLAASAATRGATRSASSRDDDGITGPGADDDDALKVSIVSSRIGCSC